MPYTTSSEDERAAFLNTRATNTKSPHLNDVDDLEILLKRVSYRRRPFQLLVWARSRPRIIRRSFRRHPVQSLLRTLKYICFSLLAICILTPIVAPSYTELPPHYKSLQARCKIATGPGCANPFREKIFISVSLYDKGGRLAGGNWGETVLELINLIGPRNAFLSIYENDSGPEGTAALQEFKKKVPCKHEIVSDAHVSLEGFPNVTMPDGSQRTKRLAYLSEIRNRALRPLDKYSADSGVVEYDKILFLNDVAFRPMDAAHLLFNTDIDRDGHTKYLAACALDYKDPFLFYDLYAQRDADGYSNGLPLYPIFSTAGEALSRHDVLAQKDAVPVSSCWSGLVAMQARYVQNMESSLPSPDWQDLNAHVIDPEHPKKVTAPVRFRHEPEIFFDACECCLFMADVAEAARKERARETGIVVNPYIRVAYDYSVLGWLPVMKRFERLFRFPHAVISKLVGLPTHNPHRTVKEGERFKEEIWDGDHWKMVDRTGRNGLFCGVREMQLVREGDRIGDVNWVNTKIPAGQTLDFPT